MPYTAKQVCEILNISRDQLNYARRAKGLVSPRVKENKRLEFSDQDIAALRATVAAKTKPVGALLLLSVETAHTESVAKRLARMQRVVWSAVAYGPTSIMVLTEQPSFEVLTSSIVDIHSIGHITRLVSHPIFPDFYYGNPPEQSPGSRFACVLLRVEYSGVLTHVLEQIREIKEVRRCGLIVGEWDIFLEFRYENETQLKDFLMKEVLRMRYIVDTLTMIALPDYSYPGDLYVDSKEGTTR